MKADPAEQAILDLLTAGAGAKSIAPADAARLLVRDPEQKWQRQLPAIRRAALRLAAAGRIEILRKGQPVPPDEARGVIRLRLAAQP